MNDQILKKFWQQWKSYQKDNLLRVSKQRNEIIRKFLELQQHVSVDELLYDVRKLSPKIGYATVYRTLKHLVRAGLATERKFDEAAHTRYEITGPLTHHHDHLICIKCGLIVEFTNNQIDELQQIAQKLGGFTIVKHKLELYAACPEQKGISPVECRHLAEKA